MAGAVFISACTPRQLPWAAAEMSTVDANFVGKNPTLPSRLKPDMRNNVKRDSEKEYFTGRIAGAKKCACPS